MDLNEHFKKVILKSTGASQCIPEKKIQTLWSGYGEIRRYLLEDSAISSVVVKHVKLPEGKKHPRGWDTDFSHQRKVQSYEVETAWYYKWAAECSDKCYVPKCLALESGEGELFMVLEDLDAVGFPIRRTSLSPKEMRVCLKWLAHFHAKFMGKSPDDLWPVGTYWHLETRPDEWKALKDRDLKTAASLIDKKLNESPFLTLVHGDAKLANFCFSEDCQSVAAVDFQYVGGGCGMKDVAYFIGSCLYEEDCERHEEELLNYYFSVLVNVMKSKQPDFDVKGLEQSWRELFPVAWADFHRFIKGWSPGHWKINSYSEKMTRKVLERVL